jgi:hypothetical protein
LAWSALLAATAPACNDELEGPERPLAAQLYEGRLADTLLLGDGDNAEAVRVVGDTSTALVLSAKARKLTLVRVEGEQLVALRSRALFAVEPGESELTHLAVSAAGDWAVVSRTLVGKDDTGAITSCQGAVAFIDVRDTSAFGTVLGEVSVGPMPDAVAVSDDDAFVAVANERDVVWGKCEGVPDLDPPSVSILAVAAGPASANEVARVVMSPENREPESVAFGSDNDLVVVTLQDSHEVALLRVSEVVLLASPTSANTLVTRLPANEGGADPWPDGVARFLSADGHEHFAIAGEASDQLLIIDGSGTVVSAASLSPTDLPGSWPYLDGSWGTFFELDSVAAVPWLGTAHVAVSLKGAGAVAVWCVSEPSRPQLAQLVKVGHGESGLPGPSETGSSLGTEGVAASGHHGFLLTANEGESSVSLVLPVD